MRMHVHMPKILYNKGKTQAHQKWSQTRSHVEMAGQSLRARVEYVQFQNRVAPLAILNLHIVGNADVHGAAIPPQAPRGPRQVATNHLRSCSQNTSVGAALWLGAHASQYMP